MTSSVSGFVHAISATIINPVLELLFALGLLLFIVGVVEFLIGLNRGDNDAKKKGTQHLLWGVVGMFIMLCAIAILTFIANLVCNNGGLEGCGPPTNLNQSGGNYNQSGPFGPKP